MKEKLQSWIDDNKITRAEFARRSGVHYQTLTDVLRGKTADDAISVTNALKIAATMGMTVEALYDMQVPDHKESNLLSLYRSVNAEGQEEVIKQARLVEKSGEYKKNHIDGSVEKRGA